MWRILMSSQMRKSLMARKYTPRQDLPTKARTGGALRMDSLLCVLMLLPPVWLYSLPNCIIDISDPRKVSCEHYNQSRIPPDIPQTAVFLLIMSNVIPKIRTSDFSALTELQSLKLINNNISHIEDAAFSHLSLLNELHLDSNRLKNLTNGMFQGLYNLTFLDLTDNLIQSISESVFAPLKKLQVLDLSKNLLSGIRDIVFAVSFSPLLKALDLSDNILTSFESETFQVPLNVRELSLGLNPLSSFTLHSDVLPHLQELYFTSSIRFEFQWNVSDKAFLKGLRTLGLSWADLRNETYHLILQSAFSLENLLLGGDAVDEGMLDFACGIQSLQKLDLSHITMSVLNSSLLQPCSQLTELILTHNTLTDLSPSALHMLTRLSKLDLGSNVLTRVPLAIRSRSTLTILNLQNNRIEKLQCLDFSDLRLLKELDLTGNKLIELDTCVFQHLHSLEELNLRNNFIELFDNSFSISLSNLRVINATGNQINHFPKGVLNNMPSLTHLHLESETEMLMDEGAFDELPNLTTLSLSPRVFFTDTLVGPNLTSRGRSELPQVFNLPSLQTLQVYASCEFLYSTPCYLKGLDNLKVFFSEDLFCLFKDVDAFSYTLHLSDLKIKKNRVDELNLNPALFHPTPALQTLDLSENHLKSLDFLLEANLTQLQKLILNNNELSVINVKVFEALPSLQYLDLLENPFDCNCSNADFIYWTIFNRQVYVKRAFQYRCASPPSHLGLPLLDFNFRWCWEYPGFLCFVSSSALVLLTLLCTFIHHFLRFQLLYSFYLLRALLYHRQKQRQGCAPVYDAFVSYNIHDEEWVYHELVPELEERQGWRLCLHHRDFQPGKAILENITDAIYSSRKTLCVISQHYLHSEWCSREIQMASFRLLDEKKDVLVLLFLEELSSSQLSPFFRMRKLLRRRTYVSWSGARGHRGLFWERVRRALQSGAELPAEGPLPPDV